MMNRKVWPLLLIVLFGGVFWAFTGRKSGEDIYAKQQRLLAAIGTYLQRFPASIPDYDNVSLPRGDEVYGMLGNLLVGPHKLDQRSCIQSEEARV